MKKVTFKEYFATLLGGLWQAILWVIGLFGYKDESSFGKVVKRIFASCATILLILFTGCVLYAFATEVVYDEWLRPHIMIRFGMRNTSVITSCSNRCITRTKVEYMIKIKELCCSMMLIGW